MSTISARLAKSEQSPSIPLHPIELTRMNAHAQTTPLNFSSPSAATAFLDSLHTLQTEWARLHPLLPNEILEEVEAQLAASAYPLNGLQELLQLVTESPTAIQPALRQRPADLVAALRIFGRSRFLSARLRRHPEWLNEVLTEGYLHQTKPRAQFEQDAGTLLGSQDVWEPLELKNALRRFKYREYFRITVRDLNDLAPPEDILAELTSVACVTLEWALRAATLVALREPLQTKRLEQSGGLSPFMVLGMGKLGGNEINYSSDVDLIFVHDNKPITGDASRDQPLRQKIARSFIEWCTEYTEDGFLARVDMRLRPGGDSSALVLPLEQVEAYYWSRASLWEQQALIKAAYVAGDPEIADFFFRMLTPYIYRRSVDENLLREVEHIKQRIEKEHLRESQLNVKLGVGGIREIEFFVQVFQLLYGGGRKELRTTNTLAALQGLQQAHLLSAEDEATLRACYLALRKLEHRLQMIEEQQTHTLSADVETQQRFARLLDFCTDDFEDDRQHLLQHIRDTMAAVRGIFGGLFDQTHLEVEASLRNSTRFRHFSEADSRLLENVARQLSPVLRQTAEDLLQKRFFRLFDSIGGRLEHYPPLLKHPATWERLATIASTSETLWNHLLNHTELLQRLDPSELRIQRKAWQHELQQQLAACAFEEDELDTLRRFKHTQTFLLGSAELDGLITYEKAREGLTLLAEIVLQAAFELCFKALQQRFGSPLHRDGTPAKFAIIGMGKLGGSELTYHSDLDLIFIYSAGGETDGARKQGNQQFYVKLIQRLITTLSTMTGAGFAYKLDTRLRPSGNSGVLVTALDAYADYHRTSQPWEHQALIKGRVVGGDEEKEWRERVTQVLQRSVYEWKAPEDMRQQIAHLRYRKETELAGETSRKRNLKEGRGGLLDIEFLAQYLQLRHAVDHPELRTPSTLEAIQACGALQLLSAEEVNTLRHAYRWVRLIENYLRLLYDESVNTLDFDKLPQGPLLTLLSRHNLHSGDLDQELGRITADVRTIYDRIFQQEPAA